MVMVHYRVGTTPQVPLAITPETETNAYSTHNAHKKLVHISQDVNGDTVRKMTQLGLRDSDVQDNLSVQQNTQVVLHADPDRYSAIVPKIITANSIDTYKTWIGREDSDLSDGHWTWSSQPWGGRCISQVSDLTLNELADIEKAGWVYLFGNSQLVSSYREALECCNAPFKAAVYAVKHVELKRGSSLVVQGMPAVLLFDELVMAPESQLVIYTVCNATFGHLHKQAI